LKGNGLVALLGDRDFSANSITVEFFGRPVPMPRGPAALSRRLGAPLIPIFMIRERDDSFRLEIERPIYPEPEEELSRGDEAGAIKALMLRYLKVIEDYVRRYPEQWYMFRGVWNGGKDLRPNTII
jgi:KDO2-lipid IV(A) lauroyltransferase